jgi:hypothetical protein
MNLTASSTDSQNDGGSLKFQRFSATLATLLCTPDADIRAFTPARMAEQVNQ